LGRVERRGGPDKKGGQKGGGLQVEEMVGEGLYWASLGERTKVTDAGGGGDFPKGGVLILSDPQEKRSGTQSLRERCPGRTRSLEGALKDGRGTERKIGEKKIMAERRAVKKG